MPDSQPPTASAREWRLLDTPLEARARLAEACRIEPLVAALLIARGYGDVDAATAFLNPCASDLSDPLLMSGMPAAVERLRTALDRQQHIRIFGDYDVDGITGTAILFECLAGMGGQVSFALPHRLETGYGLQLGDVEAAHAEGVQLLVTVDNGVAAHEAAERARALGLDLVITDHHALPDELPNALAIVNPQQDGPEHPAWNISGAAVAWKLAAALSGSKAGLDLAALGVIADVVPLTGENRLIAAAGLELIRGKPRLGLRKLAAKARIKLEELQASMVAFQIAPRLNAGGRLGDATRGLRLLLATSAAEAEALATELDAENQARRRIEKDMLETAAARSEPLIGEGALTLSLADPQWHPGVLGIVAGRLQRAANRPVLLLQDDPESGLMKGSGRSIRGFNMVEALRQCSPWLERFGGHEMAAGLSLPREHFEFFSAAFENTAREMLGGVLPAPIQQIDAQVSLSEVTPAMLRQLERLAPFGEGNPEPVFCVFAADLVSDHLRVAGQDHLQLAVRQGNCMLRAIAFRMGHRYHELRPLERVDLAFTLQWDRFTGPGAIQLVVRDIRPALPA